MNQIFNLFNIPYMVRYGGTGWIWLLFLASIVYLIITEKKKHIRLIIIWVSIAEILLFICPLTYKIFSRFLDAPTYYRIIWSIPIGIMIAFAGTKAFLKHRIIGLAVCCGIIVLTGSKVYHNQYLSISENEYQLPQQMIEICDAIHPEYFDVMACFPEEYVHYVLQYDTNIHLVYGRESLVDGWSDTNVFYVMEKMNVIDVERLTELCIEEQVVYYVARKDKPTLASFSDYGWEMVYESNDYYVYRQMAVLSTWEKVKEWLSTVSDEERNEWLDSQGIPRDYQK